MYLLTEHIQHNVDYNCKINALLIMLPTIQNVIVTTKNNVVSIDTTTGTAHEIVYSLISHLGLIDFMDIKI